MANRFPLVVDSINLNIKELPLGDNLDLTGSGIVNITSLDTATVSFTALAGATTLLTLGGTGALASTFFPSTLDTTSSTTGAIRTSGGISAAKAANIGTTLYVGGAVTLASTINKLTLTAPATGSTITIADGKTLTVSNTLAFTGTDSSSVAFGTGGTVVYTSNKLSELTATSSSELAGVISDETGTGNVVFSTNPVLTNATFTNYTETANVNSTSGATTTIALTAGTVQILTLTAACTITMPAVAAGKSFTLLLKQDATGSRTVTWSTVSWPSATAPTLTTTALKMDKFVFISDGSSWFGSTAGQAYT